MSDEKKTCFIIMPITTPKEYIEIYNDDADHFSHVLDHLFIPAIENAGFSPISPKASGSDIIHADIIKNLSECDLVLCDMSILNPNVFFEFGIRSALDKPVALVKDNITERIPFDTSIINYYEYECSLDVWTTKKVVPELSTHIVNAYNKSNNRNSLWKYFGVAQKGVYSPEEVGIGEKIDYLVHEISSLKDYLSKFQRANDAQVIYVPNELYEKSITQIFELREKVQSEIKLLDKELSKRYFSDSSTVDIENNLEKLYNVKRLIDQLINLSIDS